MLSYNLLVSWMVHNKEKGWIDELEKFWIWEDINYWSKCSFSDKII